MSKAAKTKRARAKKQGFISFRDCLDVCRRCSWSILIRYTCLKGLRKETRTHRGRFLTISSSSWGVCMKIPLGAIASLTASLRSSADGRLSSKAKKASDQPEAQGDMLSNASVNCFIHMGISTSPAARLLAMSCYTWKNSASRMA